MRTAAATRHTLVPAFIVLLLYAGSAWYLWHHYGHTLYSDPAHVQSFVLNTGVYAPLVFVLLQAVQVVFAPIPGQVTGFVGGYLFGTILGTLYALVGAMLGSGVVFLLVRRYGRTLVHRYVEPSTLKRFAYMARTKGPVALFFVYLVPGLPDDVVSFIAGLSSLPIRTLLAISFIGRLPGYFALAYVGDSLAQGREPTVTIGLCCAVTAVLVLAYYNAGRIERYIRRYA